MASLVGMRLFDNKVAFPDMESLVHVSGDATLTVQDSRHCATSAQ